MRIGQKLWSREELILAMNLYCKIPFGKLHQRNPDIIHLANLIGRTPGSLAFKLVNFASLDPSLKERGIKGAVNASKLDAEIWNEFYDNWDVLPFESEKLLAAIEHKTIEELNDVDIDQIQLVGKERLQIIKARVNQSFFRKTILASYNYTCCITGISHPELLVAGHISPWGQDEANRMNPRNGIAINALHDKAFETGYLTITSDYKIKISPLLLRKKNEHNEKYFSCYEGKDIILPTKFLPDPAFLNLHNDRLRR